MKQVILIMLIHHRQQELITLLLQSPNWYKLEEIARHVKCSEKTVRRDLIYLKDFLPSEWKIQIIKGKGVKLNKPPHCSSAKMYSFFKKNNIIFQILNQILEGDVRTVSELANTLYMPAASLSLSLQKVQEYLTPFKLRLQKKPLRIMGIEPHIVYMFYELYFTTYNWEEWPFENKADIFRYISKIEKALNIQFYPIYKQRMAFLLAISLKRKKQGHPMIILPVYAELVIETPFYRKIKEIPSVICDMLLTEMDQILVTVAINCFNFIHLDNNNYKHEILQDFYQEKSIIPQCTKKLIQKLERAFGILFSQDEEFIFNLLKYIKQITYRYQFIPEVTLPISDEHVKVKEKHTETFKKVSKIYTEWIQQHPFIPYVYEEDIIVITLQIEATIQLKQLVRKKALLYVGDSVLWKRYIQGVLYKEFGHKLIVSSEEVLNIYTVDFCKTDTEFILTTVPLSEMPLPVIQISVLPTKRELKDIKAFLDE